MNVLVIDIGTSSMRGILYNSNIDKIMSRQIKYQPRYHADGHMEQAAEEFERTFLAITREISAKAKNLHAEIDVVVLTAQRSSVVPVDYRGTPLMPVIMWQDTRNKEICKSLEKFQDEIVNRSGARINTVFSGGKMAWLKQERPDIYQKAEKLLNIPEYLIHQMTGEYITDYTYGSRSNLMNLGTCSWDAILLDIFGIDQNKLCRLQPPGSVCGNITLGFAKKSGLKEGIPVMTAGGDQQCAAIGQGVFQEGRLSVVTGTGAFLITTCSQIPENLTQDVICNCSSVRGKYIIETNVLSCCSAFDWFCRNFYDWDKIDYHRINRELQSAEDMQEQCLTLPYFQGRSTPAWNSSARASIHNITLGSTRTDILKSLVEGIFLEIRNNIELLRQYARIDEAFISGGMTNSSIMNQMQADIYGIPLYHREDTESTAIGALMVVLNEMGICDSYDEIYKKILEKNQGDFYECKADKYLFYNSKQREMNRLYKKIYG